MLDSRENAIKDKFLKHIKTSRIITPIAQISTAFSDEFRIFSLQRFCEAYNIKNKHLNFPNRQLFKL